MIVRQMLRQSKSKWISSSSVEIISRDSRGFAQQRFRGCTTLRSCCQSKRILLGDGRCPRCQCCYVCHTLGAAERRCLPLPRAHTDGIRLPRIFLRTSYFLFTKLLQQIRPAGPGRWGVLRPSRNGNAQHGDGGKPHTLPRARTHVLGAPAVARQDQGPGARLHDGAEGGCGHGQVRYICTSVKLCVRRV